MKFRCHAEGTHEAVIGGIAGRSGSRHPSDISTEGVSFSGFDFFLEAPDVAFFDMKKGVEYLGLQRGETWFQGSQKVLHFLAAGVAVKGAFIFGHRKAESSSFLRYGVFGKIDQWPNRPDFLPASPGSRCKAFEPPGEKKVQEHRFDNVIEMMSQGDATIPLFCSVAEENAVSEVCTEAAGGPFFPVTDDIEYRIAEDLVANAETGTVFGNFFKTRAMPRDVYRQGGKIEFKRPGLLKFSQCRNEQKTVLPSGQTDENAVSPLNHTV